MYKIIKNMIEELESIFKNEKLDTTTLNNLTTIQLCLIEIAKDLEKKNNKGGKIV